MPGLRRLEGARHGRGRNRRGKVHVEAHAVAGEAQPLVEGMGAGAPPPKLYTFTVPASIFREPIRISS